MLINKTTNIHLPPTHHPTIAKIRKKQITPTLPPTVANTPKCHNTKTCNKHGVTKHITNIYSSLQQINNTNLAIQSSRMHTNNPINKTLLLRHESQTQLRKCVEAYTRQLRNAKIIRVSSDDDVFGTSNSQTPGMNLP